MIDHISPHFQLQPEEHKDVIRHMAKLYDRITVPSAKSSILWLIGEYCAFVPTLAPDVLRKAAQSFVREDISVKQQTLNLAVKLFLTNPAQTTLLLHYLLTLARYDQNYDIRDRVRMIRAILLPPGVAAGLATPGGGSGSSLAATTPTPDSTTNGAHAKDDLSSTATTVMADSPVDPSALFSKFASKIFFSAKPAPLAESRHHKAAEEFRLGTLSHCMKSRAAGYEDLPPFPEVAPDSSARNVELPTPSPLGIESGSAIGNITDRFGKSARAPSNRHPESASGDAGDNERAFWSDADGSPEELEDEDDEESGGDEEEDDDDESDDDEEDGPERVSPAGPKPETQSGDESDDEEESDEDEVEESGSDEDEEDDDDTDDGGESGAESDIESAADQVDARSGQVASNRIAKHSGDAGPRAKSESAVTKNGGDKRRDKRTTAARDPPTTTANDLLLDFDDGKALLFNRVH